MVVFITHKGDLNTKFKLTMYDNVNGTKTLIDLTNYTNYFMEFQNEQQQSVGIFVAPLFGTASQGIINYINTSTTFLNAIATWRRRGILQNTISGAYFTGSWVEWENQP